jgi:hypothetical protein
MLFLVLEPTHQNYMSCSSSRFEYQECSWTFKASHKKNVPVNYYLILKGKAHLKSFRYLTMKQPPIEVKGGHLAQERFL